MKRFFALILIFLLSVSSFGCDYAGLYYEKSEIFFEGSAIALSVRLYGGKEKDAYNEMVRTIKALDAELSLTRKDSALYRFNESTDVGERVEVSRHAYEIIELALSIEEKTDGAFSIGALNINKLWHLESHVYPQFNKLFPEPLNFTLPTVGEVKATLLNCDTSALILEHDSEQDKYYIAKSNKELRIDLGAIAKGYCADLCYDIMGQYGIESGVVNISGNVILKGLSYDGKNYSSWLTRVDNPRQRYELSRSVLCALELEGGVSIVTSGDYERFFLHSDNITLCHIVNPVTGYPSGVEPTDASDENCNTYRMSAESVSSASVISISSALADALSTAIFVKGIEECGEILSRFEGVSALVFSQSYSSDNYYNGENARRTVYGGIEFYEEDIFSVFKSYALYSG